MIIERNGASLNGRNWSTDRAFAKRVFTLLSSGAAGWHVDSNYGAKFGCSISFDRTNSESLFKSLGQRNGHFLSTNDHDIDGFELFGFDSFEETAKEGGCTKNNGALVGFDEFSDLFGFEWVLVKCT